MAAVVIACLVQEEVEAKIEDIDEDILNLYWLLFQITLCIALIAFLLVTLTSVLIAR